MPQQIDSPAFAYPNLQFLPFKEPHRARRVPVNLAPSTVFTRGTLLGQITSAATDVQTITITGSPTGGTITLTFPNGQTTGAIAYNTSLSAMAAALAPIFGTPNIAVTGTAGASYVLTAAGNLVGLPLGLLTVTGALTGGTTPAVAVVHTTLGRSAGTFAAYNDSNSNGTETARGILQNDVTTDGGGNVFFGPVAGTSRWGESYPTASMWAGGIFRTVGTTGLDAAAMVDLGAHLESGSIADGVIVIP